MANVTIAPKTWKLVFDATTNGSFRVINFKGKALRATALPTSGGVTISIDEHGPSELFSHVSDGVSSLYVYNGSDRTGVVERDI